MSMSGLFNFLFGSDKDQVTILVPPEDRLAFDKYYPLVERMLAIEPLLQLSLEPNNELAAFLKQNPFYLERMQRMSEYMLKHLNVQTAEDPNLTEVDMFVHALSFMKETNGYSMVIFLRDSDIRKLSFGGLFFKNIEFLEAAYRDFKKYQHKLVQATMSEQKEPALNMQRTTAIAPLPTLSPMPSPTPSPTLVPSPPFTARGRKRSISEVTIVEEDKARADKMRAPKQAKK
ncbi:MAG: hypothetical protein ACHQJ6_04940 [Candidatus Berkiellales bacterium]